MNTPQIPQEITNMINAGALVVCDHSGGKDSQAMFSYLKSFVPKDQLIVIHAHLPGVEWEGVVDHITNTIDGYEFHEVKAKKTFLEMVERRGMWPSSSTRQCTSDLKRDPIDAQIRKIAKERGVNTIINCMGIRAQESAARAKKNPFKVNTRNSVAGRQWFDWYPIFEMSVEWVWQTIAEAGQKRHWAYDAGMSRLSCCFCILGNKADHKIAAKLNPALLDQIDALEHKIGHTLISPKKGQAPVYFKEYLSLNDASIKKDVDELMEMVNDPKNFCN